MLQTHYFFIDECGDPEFYGKRKKLLVGTEGFQPLLILGMVETPNRFNRKHKNNSSKFYLELSIVDYFLWALQRYLLKGEIRFWQSIEPLAGKIVDLYGEGPRVYDGESETHLLRLDKLKPPLNL
ncbi:hypothetical protein [Runella limosa]|uniref:hypothetical protein n=1 Tax=Runella limosa TaxID=370978 RepID=UPI00048F8C6C|nr:hypothetical protein [Runella limosa]